MKPFIVLIAAFVLALIVSKVTTYEWHLVFSGNLAMFLMLCLTAIGHFRFTKGMVMMIPAFFPLKKLLVYVTGILEVVLGLHLLSPQYRYPGGIWLIALFIIMLPANISAAIRHVDYEHGTYTGSGPSYLWFRIPLQLFFIVWVWYFAVK